MAGGIRDNEFGDGGTLTEVTKPGSIPAKDCEEMKLIEGED